MTKSPQQLKNERDLLIGALLVLLAIIAFIGMNNVSTTQAASYYQDEHSKAKAKADYFQNEYNAIKNSGTCLMRDPRLEMCV